MQIARDKIYHFVAGFVIAGVILLISKGNMALAAGAAVGAGVLKELSDYVSNEVAERDGREPEHSLEMLDAIATVLGGAVACLTYGWLG